MTVAPDAVKPVAKTAARKAEPDMSSGDLRRFATELDTAIATLAAGLYERLDKIDRNIVALAEAVNIVGASQDAAAQTAYEARDALNEALSKGGIGGLLKMAMGGTKLFGRNTIEGNAQ